MTSLTTPASYAESLFSLQGQLAVVTGASRGIGLAITTALASAGADIVAVSRDMPEGDGETRRVVQALGRKFTPLRADFSAREQVVELAGDLAGRGVDILVNNAGAIRRSPATEHSDEDFDYVMDVNLRATFILSREVGASMVRRGHGKIVNTASLLSFQGGLNVAGYASSKSAVAGLTKALANEWAPMGVNVNAVAPGYVATANTADLRQDAVRSQEILDRIPAGRWAQASDVAGAVLFLCSRAADYVHGITLAVDGGWLAR
jgi:2-deoxy-D-gluconate 3-dehydrogenase